MIDGKLNLLSQEEITQLKTALEVKRDIISYLDMELFIDNTRKIIESSNTFEFRSIASKLFIDKNQPVFVLKIKDIALLEEIQKMNKPMDEITKLLQNEIIMNISKLLTDCLKEDKNELFKGVPKEIKEFIISNIYVIRSNIKENNIQLFFFV